MLDSIRQAGQYYYDNLPVNSIRSIGESALLSFTITVAFRKGPDGVIDLSRPLVAAAVAALASLIHAVITPIIDYFMGSQNWPSEFIKQTVSVVLTSSVINAYSSSPSLDKFVVYGALSINLFLVIFGKLQSNDNSAYIYFY